jgi:hypothetical protein
MINQSGKTKKIIPQTEKARKSLPSQGHYGFHSFPVYLMWTSCQVENVLHFLPLIQNVEVVVFQLGNYQGYYINDFLAFSV